MEIKKDYNQFEMLQECFDTIIGYFYLIEMDLLLLEVEYGYEYEEKLLYYDYSNFYANPEEYTKH